MAATHDKPLAAAGFDSYRCRSPYGWIMIGANSIDEALREARRSMDSGQPRLIDLQAWGGSAYADVVPEGLARALFDATPHRHPAGLTPDWDVQPQHVKDVFRRKADTPYGRR